MVVALEAKAIASEHSKSIPPSIKVRTSGATVAIIAGGRGVPLASLYESGNAGGIKSRSALWTGRFRHPVFGNRDVWVWQDLHHYLAPAAAARAVEVERDVVAALDEAVKTIALRG